MSRGGVALSRNGVSIVGLQPVDTAIPGNEPYAVPRAG